MIYTRMGSPVHVLGDAGMQRPGYLKYRARLLRIAFNDSSLGWCWLHTLKADGGVEEIERARLASPRLELTGPELVNAFKDAK